MAKRKPTMKNDKQRKRPRNPGKLQLEDYKAISKQLGIDISQLGEGTSMFTKMSAIKAKVDYKILQLEKKGKPEPKVTQPIEWKCMTCGTIHTKRKMVATCPDCDGTNIQRLNG